MLECLYSVLHFIRRSILDQTALVNTSFVACPESFEFASRVHNILSSYCPPGILQTIQYTRFASGEWYAKIPETVRNTHVVLFHAFQPDPTTSFMKLLIAANALQLASVASIRLMLPFMPYQRQDRKDEARVPITAKLVWNMIQTNPKITHVITMDMHSEQEQGFTDLPVDNFPANRIHVEHLLHAYAGELDNMLIVAPDAGSAVRVKRFAKRLLKETGFEPSIGWLDKRRPAPNVAEIANYTGPDPRGKIVVLYDDMIDTGGTIIEAANFIAGLGAQEVVIIATHGIFSAKIDARGNFVTAEEKLSASGHHVIVTNTIPRSKEYQAQHGLWLTMLSIEDTIARVIYESFRRAGSVSEL